MSRFTVLRVEVDSDIVERVLDLTPGVEVVEGFDADGAESGPRDDVTSTRDDAGPTHDGPADDDGLLAGATPDEALLDEGSPIREYGLLGVGVSFVMLGIATVGIWWYRRRKGGAAETADDGFDQPTDTGPTTVGTPDRETVTAGTDTGRETASVSTDTDKEPGTADTGSESPTTTASDETETDSASATADDSLSIVRPDERDDTDDETASSGTAATTDDAETDADGASDDTGDDHAGRSEDREDAEWTTKWDTDKASEGDDEDAETEETAEPAGPASNSVDVAPLLGVAFLAVSGAVARWVEGGEE